MPAIKKTALKALIKECLLEILQDEKILTDAFSQILREGVGTLTEKSFREKPVQNHHIPSPSPVNPNFNKTVSRIANEMSPKDKIFQHIIADTAITTLQEQRESAYPVGNGLAVPDAADQIAAASSPESLFSGADRWAQLAFMPKGNKS